MNSKIMRLAHWLLIALIISVLFNLGTLYYAVQVQQELRSSKNAQIEREKTAQERQEDLQMRLMASHACSEVSSNEHDDHSLA